MVSLPEDWEKPRSKSTHLTAEEIQQLRVAYNCGKLAREAARELKCSTRTVNKYFADFGGNSNRVIGKRQFERRPIRPVAGDQYYFESSKPRPAFDPVKHRESRHYRGSFEL